MITITINSCGQWGILWHEFQSKLSAKELMLLNCGVGEDSWESLGLQGDPTSPFWRRSARDFFGRNDAKAETAVLWPPHVKSWLIGKDSDAGRDWGQEEKGMTEDEMAGWYHWLDGCESQWTPGVGDGQGGLACCNSWGRKESDMTEWLNWAETMWNFICITHKNICKLKKRQATRSVNMLIFLSINFSSTQAYTLNQKMITFNWFLYRGKNHQIKLHFSLG